MKTFPVYLNGKLTVTGATRKIVNPANGEVVGEMSTVGRDAVAQALKDAQAAAADWKKTHARVRGDWLRKIADELEKRGDEIAKLITLENGKPLAQSKGEIAMSLDQLRWFAEEGRRGYGRVIPPQVDGKRHLVIKTPIGVVAAISPWNFPLALAVRKIAPALAAGCPVILKPASATPMCAAAFAECVDAVKLPSGLFQLVAGSATEIAQEFLDNPICRKITFTGSTEVGRLLIAGAAKHVKPLSLELGGLGPLLVFADADLEAAAEGTLLAKFRNTGQSCIAANRIYVERSVYDQFLKIFVEKTKAQKMGDGMDPQNTIGPLIDEAGVAKAVEQVEDAVRNGAKILCGGKRVPGKGYFFEPTVLADVKQKSLCLCEETFAPIAPVSAFDTEAEAIAEANRSDYGLSAYAFTRDLSRMFRLAESLEAGVIGINDGLPTTTQAPFGGVKQSGWGRELGSEGLDAFMETKYVSIGVS